MRVLCVRLHLFIRGACGQNRMLAFLLMKNVQRHTDVEDLERYSMGNSSPAESAPIEEHLLTCDECRHRLRETDDYLLALRTASAGLRRDEIIVARGQWRFPAWLPVLAAVACLLVMIFALRRGRPAAGPVVAISLTAMRGNGAGNSAPAGRELMLHPDLTSLAEASSYRLEIVDQTGRARVRSHARKMAFGSRVWTRACTLCAYICPRADCCANTASKSNKPSELHPPIRAATVRERSLFTPSNPLPIQG
jgi:hypothetical protein